MISKAGVDAALAEPGGRLLAVEFRGGEWAVVMAGDSAGGEYVESHLADEATAEYALTLLQPEPALVAALKQARESARTVAAELERIAAMPTAVEVGVRQEGGTYVPLPVVLRALKAALGEG